MQQHGSKRKKVAIRFFSYGVMTLATVIFSFICILLILGYQFDLQKGTVEQGGLLQFRSFPSAATIRLDGKTLSFKTPGKENVAVGKHSVTLTRSGYEDWSKSFSIKAGELRWLNYGRFIPKNVKTTPVKSFETLSASLPSPDRKWIALQIATTEPSLTLVDIRNQDSLKYTPLSFPANTYTTVEGQVSNFTIKEWDFGARYMIVQHVSGGQTEFLRVDRTDPANTKNITAQFRLPISDLHFSGSSGNVFYGIANGDIRKFDLGGGTISEPLASNVTAFQLYKSDVIAYTTAKENQLSAGVIIDNKATVVRTYDVSTPIFVDISEYFDNNYLAIAHGTTVDVIKDPVDHAGKKDKPYASVAFSEGVKWLRFASSGRFVVAGNGNHFVTHDLETTETFSPALPGVSTVADMPLQWLDDYYLVSDVDDTLRISEFDGSNQHVLTPMQSGFKVTLNDNGKRLYSVVKTDTGFSLQATVMTLN